MIIFFTIVGLFLGGVFGGVWGAIVGAILGYLVANQLSLQEKLTRLENRLKGLGQLPVESQGQALPEEQPEQEPAPEAPVAAEKEAEAGGEETTPEPIAQATEEADISAFSRVEPEAAEVVPGTPIEAGEPPSNPIVAFFTGGNAAVRIGIVVLFFGIAFLLKYAIDHDKFPIEFRLISISIGAIVMLVIGWRLRESRPGYALSLQGGAVGILYLVVFAALRLYHLIPPGAAFTLLVLIVAFSAALAILQDSIVLAVFGVVGGFLAPLLTSTDAGNHVMLFSYYSVLNLGILAVAWRKSWRLLNLIGFAFTFVIASIWGYLSYRPEHFATTEPFLVFFVLLYIVIAILFATRQKPELLGYVDGPIVFGTPIVGFGLQSFLVRDFEYGLAWSALVLGLLYLSLASVLVKRHGKKLGLLIRAFLGIGVLFGTLVIPLAFDGRWTSAAWAAEGSAAIWIGVQQRHRLPRWFGVLLLFGSSAAFLSDFNNPVGTWPLLNSFYVGCLIISIAALFSAYQYFRNREHLDEVERQPAHILLLLLGLAWWFTGGLFELHDYVDHTYRLNSYFGFVVLSSLLAVLLARKLNWKSLGNTAFILLPTMVLAMLAQFLTVSQPLAHGGYISWPIAFATYYSLLKQNENYLPGRYREFGHAISLWLAMFLIAWLAYWLVGKVEALSQVWLDITLALVPAIIIHAIGRVSRKPDFWPVGVHARTYLGLAIPPVMALLWFGAVYVSLTNNGEARPLPYIPVLNPIDLTQILVFVVAGSWFIRAKQMELSVVRPDWRAPLYAITAVTVFLWLNAVLLRTIHHWVHVPFNLHAMSHSELVQTSLSIFWGLLGFATMVFANRVRNRVIWLTGALLLGVVVVKLFLVDLAQSGTIERIISFIVVGILLLVVGYFTPVPPKQGTGEGDS
ncbi:MAG: DUF2339 domain-containing protein [Acidiferrobacterales bacterium]